MWFPLPCFVRKSSSCKQDLGDTHSAPFSTLDSDMLLGLREDTPGGQWPQQWAFYLPLGVRPPPHRLYPPALTDSCPSHPRLSAPQGRYCCQFWFLLCPQLLDQDLAPSTWPINVCGIDESEDLRITAPTSSLVETWGSPLTPRHRILESTLNLRIRKEGVMELCHSNSLHGLWGRLSGLPRLPPMMGTSLPPKAAHSGFGEFHGYENPSLRTEPAFFTLPFLLISDPHPLLPANPVHPLCLGVTGWGGWDLRAGILLSEALSPFFRLL